MVLAGFAVPADQRCRIGGQATDQGQAAHRGQRGKAAGAALQKLMPMPIKGPLRGLSGYANLRALVGVAEGAVA